MQRACSWEALVELKIKAMFSKLGGLKPREGVLGCLDVAPEESLEWGRVVVVGSLCGP